MSITPNAIGTQALIKVAGWAKADVPSHPAVLRVYDETDHHEAVALLRGLEWQLEDNAP